MNKINILFPVYNEELRLENGIKNTVNYFSSIAEDEYELTIVDNASSDRTQEIAERLCQDYNHVKYIRLDDKGVGIAFRAGVRANSAPIVGYMDVDLSTDVRHIGDVLRIFDNELDVEIVNGSRWNKKSETFGRKWYRNLTSHGLTLLLKISLGMRATDSICGFKFFRKSTVENLMSSIMDEEDGWFYIIELLLRAERNSINIYELPVRWQDDYRTTVDVGKLIKNYCIQIVRLRKVFRKEKREKH